MPERAAPVKLPTQDVELSADGALRGYFVDGEQGAGRAGVKVTLHQNAAEPRSSSITQLRRMLESGPVERFGSRLPGGAGLGRGLASSAVAGCGSGRIAGARAKSRARIVDLPEGTGFKRPLTSTDATRRSLT
jgi:hypothetical protein